MKKKRIIRRYGGFGAIADQVGTVLGSTAYQSDGRIDQGRSAIGTGLQGVNLGMQVGGPIGGMIGGVAGGIYGAASAAKNNREIEKQEKLQADYEMKMKNQRSRGRMSAYPTNGVEGDTRFYKKGGMYAKGGMMEGISSNAVRAEGQTHEEGGIQMGNSEIEDNEVVADFGKYNVVFSDTLRTMKGKTFAQEAEKIGRKQGKMEEKLEASKNDKHSKGTAKRTIQKQEMKMDRLATEQLEQQLAKGINPFGQESAKYGAVKRKYEDGGIDPITGEPIPANPFGDVVTSPYVDQPAQLRSTNFGKPPSAMVYNEPSLDLLSGHDYTNSNKEQRPLIGQGVGQRIQQGANAINPYIDNIVNAALINKTPQIPVPTPKAAFDKKVNYNINPQLDAMDDQTAVTNRSLERVNNNAAGVQGNLIAAQVANINAKNQLYGQKENIETQRENENVTNRQNIYNANVAMFDKYKTNKMLRQDDIHGRISSNVANAVTDRNVQIKESNLRNRDNVELELLRTKYKNSGVMDRNFDEAITKYMNKEISYEEFKKAREIADARATKLKAAREEARK